MTFPLFEPASRAPDATVRRRRVLHAVLLAASLGLGACGGTGWDAECVASRPCATPEPAPCEAASGRGRSVEDVLAEHSGTVIVEGFLSRVGNTCTELGCGEGQCCNRCEGTLAVTTEPREFLEWPLPPLVVIGAGEASACAGDDSGQCCGLAVGGPIRVRGTITSDPTSVGGLRLDATGICEP